MMLLQVVANEIFKITNNVLKNDKQGLYQAFKDISALHKAIDPTLEDILNLKYSLQGYNDKQASNWDYCYRSIGFMFESHKMNVVELYLENEK